MYIIRYIKGEPVKIDLTKHEVLNAYEEYQHEQDICLCAERLDNYPDEDLCIMFGATKETRHELAEQMANSMRHMMEVFGMTREDALDNALYIAIRKHVKGKNQ